MTAHTFLKQAWAAVGGAALDVAAVELVGDQPLLPSAFAVADLAQGVIAAACLAVATFADDTRPTVQVERNEAAVAFRSERYLRVDGSEPADLWAPLSGDYRTADGWVRIHANFDHHRDAAVRVLGLGPLATKADVAAALLRWEAEGFDARVTAAGGCAAALRSTAAWDSLPVGQAIAALPLVDIGKVGDSPRPTGTQPLAGLRVLDLTRVIAGPVCGRFLAAHGAQVLRVDGPHLPSFPGIDLDTTAGKRWCHLDLRNPADRARLAALVEAADLVVHGYRPGALDARGFGSEQLTAINPTLVTVQLSAYGWAGPWVGRRGFDSLVQVASGITAAETAAAGLGPDRPPRSLPCQALDHATGYLAALGGLAALWRRRSEGGAWHVQVSLARTAAWLKAAGQHHDGQSAPEPDPSPYLQTTASAHGAITHVAPPGLVNGRRGVWPTPPPGRGEDDPVWLEEG